ncbi:hypothetical protein [Deinococcus apachensis]|uniref:hypothetical protein n=1 Tax=Deinococcus apachensis TaxID=309886 RepID=UPI000372E5B0|nr:hypothetical protein [Deinococcus apachensis]
MRGSLLLCTLLGGASAGGSAPPPSPAEVLASLGLGDVCVGEGATVLSSEDLPNTFLLSYSEIMSGVADRHREELSFRGGKCKVYTHLTLAFGGQEPRLPYTLRLQLIRDPWNDANPGVVWESGAVGVADSLGTLENLQNVADELYLRLLADWRRTHL